jgi:hypothetical protein
MDIKQTLQKARFCDLIITETCMLNAGMQKI